MKKITMVLAMMILIVMPGYAGWVNPEMARRAAQTFLSNNRAESSDLSDVTSEAGFQNLYVFTTGNSFVVMSADDRVQPILGYSLTGGFVPENIPVNVSEWLQGYSDQIQFVKDNYPETTSEVTRQWQDLVSGTLALESSRTVVGPLITTAWDQTYPYNYYCPSASGGSGNHVYTGCGATAMAQVIKYHNAPVHGVGSHSYTHSTYGVQTANFNETTYQWDNMPTRIYSYSSQTQIDAVATLMYHCGVSIDMNYGISGSGASSSQIAPALRDYFNFSQSTTHIQRENYTDSDWIAQMRSELNASRPVIYNGYYTSGHSFVCDGYDSGSYNSDYFHFNWGWSGSYDGYFSIDDMTPGGNGAGGGGHNYSYYQDAIIGIRPSTNTAIPTNLTYTLNGRNVTLNWTSAGGNVSYNIYCNNMLVGNTTTTTYTEAAPFGTSVYYVRSVNSSGEQSLSSNSITVSVAYPTPVVDDLQATVTGNNVRLSWTAPDWCYPQTPTATLNYGEGAANYFWTSVYYAHRYLAADLAQYANKAVYKVDTYIQCAGTYTVYVYTNSNSSGNNPAPNSLAATKSVTCNGAVGWLEINLPQPVIISGTTDLWVVMKQENTSETYPTPSFNLDSYNANACYQGSSSPTSLYCNSNYNISWFINTCITDGVYTYNIYRNGSNIASNVSTTYYNNNNLSTGGYTYYVKTNYYAGESEASNSVNVVIGNVTYYNITASAQPSNGGRVSGGGSYAQGTTCTLTATANEGYIFTNWTKNGQQVSTNPTYSFTVTGNASYIANFTEAPTGPQVVAEYYPDAENPNSPYVKVYWYEAKAASSSYYHIYRASCNGNDSTLIASNVTGNEYIDQDWSYLAEGNYKYGVCFVDGRGESEIHWNNTPAPLSHHTIDASAFSAPVSNNGNADEPSLVNYSRGWLYYDDGICATNVGASGTLYWGSMFPASMLTGNSLTKVALYENGNNTGTITLYVYSGGDTAPGTLVYTQDITPVAGNAFHEITLTSPVTINPSQNLWITFYQNGDSYPACACNDTGDANNRWVSVNGSSWYDLADAGVSGYGWMIRAYVDSNGGGGGGSDGPTAWSDCLVKSSRAVVGEGGETTNSYLPSYSYYNYTLSQQIYTSDEIGDAGTITSVSFFNGGSEKTRIYDVYMVHTDKSSFANNTDWIAVTESDRVFSSSVTMSANGWTVLQFDTPFVYNGTSNIALIVDDNTGSWSSGMACRVFNANGNQAIRIYSDGTNYDPYSPSGYSGTLHSVKNQIILGFLDTDSQIIPLSSGWNWFSPNVEITLEDLQNALVEALPGTTNIKITSQSNGTTTYNGTRWRGQLSLLDLAQMYMIEVTADCEMTLSGALINPVEHSVTIHNGSNWIAFPLSGSMSLTDAFAGFVINGDKVTSQSNGSATYNNRWRGQLTTLEDGKGYIYESAATGDRTFTFPISAK